MVRKGGLEPPRPYDHKLLRLARLPIPPLSRCGHCMDRRANLSTTRSGLLDCPIGDERFSPSLGKSSDPSDDFHRSRLHRWPAQRRQVDHLQPPGRAQAGDRPRSARGDPRPQRRAGEPRRGLAGALDRHRRPHARRGSARPEPAGARRDRRIGSGAPDRRRPRRRGAGRPAHRRAAAPARQVGAAGGEQGREPEGRAGDGGVLHPGLSRADPGLRRARAGLRRAAHPDPRRPAAADRRAGRRRGAAGRDRRDARTSASRRC